MNIETALRDLLTAIEQHTDEFNTIDRAALDACVDEAFIALADSCTASETAPANLTFFPEIHPTHE